jgi:hypothetical protein
MTGISPNDSKRRDHASRDANARIWEGEGGSECQRPAEGRREASLTHAKVR